MPRWPVQRPKRWSRVLAGALIAVLLLALFVARRSIHASSQSAAVQPAAAAAASASRASVHPGPGAPPLPVPSPLAKKPVAKAAPLTQYFVESLDRQSRYTFRDGGASAFLDERGLALSLTDGARAWGLRWSMAGARPVTPVPAGPALVGVVNDLRGDPASQRTGLRTYDRIVYREVFDGVDMELEPRSRGLEYTLRVAAGARVPELRFVLDGAQSLSVQDGGQALRIDTGLGPISEGALLAYQDGPDGVRREVPVRYAHARQKGGGLVWEYGLEVGPHDPSLPLVIDPTLAWSSYIGGSSTDFLYGMAIDPAGNRYLTGYTLSPDFPHQGGFQGTFSTPNDAFVTKVSSTDSIVWSSFFGGSNADHGLDIAVDGASNVYVVGETDSNDIVMVNGFQPSFGTGMNKTDGFILKIAPNGASIIASSYLGGNDNDSAQALFLYNGDIYVTGSTSSLNFPVTGGVLQPACGSCSGSAPPDAFIARIGAAGSSLTKIWATFLGGNSDDTGYDLFADGTGVWVTGFTASSTFPTTAGAYDRTLGGQDAFLTKVNLTGTAVQWSTLVGGSGIEVARGLGVDASGNAYIAGTTQSGDLDMRGGGFDTTLGGPQDIFAAKLNPTGSTLLWSTYLGGSGTDYLYAMELDSGGQLFLGGMTDSSTGWTLVNPVDNIFAGPYEAVIARIDAGGGALGFATYLGGTGAEQVYSLGWDAAGNLYASGGSNSTDFPLAGTGLQPGYAGGTDGWVARIAGAGVITGGGAGPAKLAITTPAQTINAGACSGPVTVQAWDSLDVPANVTTATVVTLSVSPTTGFGFYSDSSCTMGAGSVTIPAGGSTAPAFYFKDDTAGSYTVTASSAPLQSASQSETINPLAASQLVFTTGSPYSVAAGSCSPALTVQRRDGLGNPTTTGPITVNLSAAAPPGFQFYSDPGCMTAATSVTIPDMSSTRDFYFQGTTAGSVNVTASAAGLGSAGPQPHNIIPASVFKLVILGVGQSVPVNGCSAMMAVERQDQYGNPITTGTTTVNMAAAPSSGFAFYSDPACGMSSSSRAIGPGSSSVGFSFKGTLAGTITVTASAAGLNSGTQNETIVAGAASVLVFTPAPGQTVAAGACSAAATVQRQDGFGNPVTSGTTTVNLSVTPTTGFSFYSDPGCMTGATTFNITTGSTGSFYFKGTVAGSFPVTAAAAGLTSGQQTEIITAGAVSKLVFSTAPQTVAAGACSAIATVQRQDANGNAVTTGTTTVNLAATPATGFNFYSDPTCGTVATAFNITSGSTGGFYFKGTAVGSFRVDATSAGLTGAFQNETITPGAVSKLVFATAPQTLAAGACSAIASVQRQDTFGNTVTAGTTAVSLSATPATGFTFYSDPACGTVATTVSIDPGASAGNFYFIGTVTGSFRVDVASAGLTGANQLETITPAAAAKLVFITTAQTVAANACSAVATVQRQDTFGNAVTAGTTAVSLSSVPAAGFSFYSDPACTMGSTTFNISGASAGNFYFRGTSTGMFAVTAAAAGLTSGTQTENISAGMATMVVFATAPQTLGHNRCSAVVTIQSQDGAGNPAPVGAPTALAFSSPTGTMTFYSDAICASPLAGPAIPSGLNTFNLYFRDSGVGSKTMNVAAAGLTGSSQVETLTNTAPIANAGVDQSQGELKAVTLTGTASTDGDSDPLTYQWSQTGGPAVMLSSTTAAQPTFTTPVVFTSTPLTFRLVVNDGFASSPADTVVVTVLNDVNEAPVANAGPDVNTRTGVGFTLDGTGSSDPNGTPITYLWTQTSGPPLALADPTAATQALTAPFVLASTTYTFQLVVNDGAAPSAPDQVTVVIGPPDFPVITSVPRRLTAASVPYQYDADSRLDVVGQAPLTFTLLQGPPGFAVAGATGVVSWTPSTAGSFPIRIQASNAFGTNEQDYTLKVVTAPVIVSTPRVNGSAFLPYGYDADRLPSAVGSPAIGWSLVQAPAGAVVVHDTGEILWTPLMSGPAAFVLRAANAFGFDDQAFAVQVGAATPPVIQATANLSAQVGRPYTYDADGVVDVLPADVPVAVERGPAGFRVDPLTAEVSWTPLSAGVFDVQLMAGVSPVQSAPYAFQVTVVDVPPAPPVAVAEARPASGSAPLYVGLDGTKSAAAPGRALMMFEWDPGDGSPPVNGAVASHQYEAPGGYTPSLQVSDELGQRAVATASVQVGAGGALPPAAQLFVDSMQPQPDGSTLVTLRCQCADPQGQPLSYFWELGDGTASSAASPSHAYQAAGAYRVVLTVSNATLSTVASVEVVVRRGGDLPPEARAYASPVRGPAPLLVHFTSSARDQDGYILQREWTFPDDDSRSDLPSVDHQFDAPGVYQVAFRTTDDDGLSSVDRVEVTVLSATGAQPPKFVSLGSQQGQVGVAYSYDEDGKPSVTGDAPMTFALESPPDGATIDAQTGAVTWTPKDGGVARLVITATNSAGHASQVLLVQVKPPSVPPIGPCGCGEAGGASAVVAGLALLLSIVKRRYSNMVHPRRCKWR